MDKIAYEFYGYHYLFRKKYPDGYSKRYYYFPNQYGEVEAVLQSRGVCKKKAKKVSIMVKV